MRPIGRCSPRLLSLVVSLVVLSASVAQADDMAITLLQPLAGQPLFGDIAIEAGLLDIDASSIAHLSFFVDGRFVGRRQAPPWLVRVDVGQDNAEHRIEVVAETHDGERASALIVSPVYRVDEEVDLPLQQLYVTVSRGDQRVLDLARDDFEVLDDGQRQTLVTFEGGDVPLTATLLLDASYSMRGDRLTSALLGARRFVSSMAELDQARLLLFSDHVLHETPFTSFSEVLRAGLSTVRARGGTAVNDHLYRAVRQLESRQGRRVVVLLSDGIDASSFLRMDEVRAAVRRSEALIYWLRLGSSQRHQQLATSWRDPKAQRREIEQLETTIDESGGRVIELSGVDEAAQAFDAILQELREQYVLGYYPSQVERDGSWRPVRVKVSGRGLDVRTRDGYLDD